MILSNCCKRLVYDDTINISSSIPLHRFIIIDKPQCNFEDGKSTYKDLVDYLLMYKVKLEQSNRDKEEVIKTLNKKDNK